MTRGAPATTWPEVTVKVPGKVMLAGEYTVLAGGAALAFTIDRHLAVRARLAEPGYGLSVGSELWPEPKDVRLGDDTVGARAEPLVAAVARGARLFDLADVALRVDSELAVKDGVGSSSALRLATLLAMEELARLKRGLAPGRPKAELWSTARAAYHLQMEAQPRASGYDVATQLVGGLVRFRGDGPGAPLASWPAEARQVDGSALTALTELVHVFVGGAGAPTGQVMGETGTWLATEDRMERLTEATTRLLGAFDQVFSGPRQTGELRHLMMATGAHRAALAGSPSFPRTLAEALGRVPGLDETWSLKTTGAGGEDAILLLGPLAEVHDAERALRRHGWKRLLAGFDRTGVRISRGGRPKLLQRPLAATGETTDA